MKRSNVKLILIALFIAITFVPGAFASDNKFPDHAPFQESVKASIANGTITPSVAPIYSTEVVEKDNQHEILKATTQITFKKSRDAGLDKWKPFTIKDNSGNGGNPQLKSLTIQDNSGNSGKPQVNLNVYKPGDYDQKIKDYIYQQIQKIPDPTERAKKLQEWNNYDFDTGERTLTYVETYSETYPDPSQDVSSYTKVLSRQSNTNNPSTTNDLSNANDPSTTYDVLMGYTYTPPSIDWEIDPSISILGFTVAECKAGIKFSAAIGMRLPTEVTLNYPDKITYPFSYPLSTSIVGADWDAAKYSAVNVPPENGNEFVGRIDLFIGLKVVLLDVDVLDYSIGSNKDFGKSFTTPIGSGQSFPDMSLDLSPSDTGLGYNFDVGTLGIGIQITQDIKPGTISAIWSASGNSNGFDSVVYSAPGQSYNFGPISARSDQRSDDANILLNNFKYNFDRCKMNFGTNIELDINGLGGIGTPYLHLFSIDDTALFGGPYMGIHPGTTANSARVTIWVVKKPQININSYLVTEDGAPHTATGTATGVNGEDLSADLDLTRTTHTYDYYNYIDSWIFHDPTGKYEDQSGTIIDVIYPPISQPPIINTPIWSGATSVEGIGASPARIFVTINGGTPHTADINWWNMHKWVVNGIPPLKAGDTISVTSKDYLCPDSGGQIGGGLCDMVDTDWWGAASTPATATVVASPVPTVTGVSQVGQAEPNYPFGTFFPPVGYVLTATITGSGFSPTTAVNFGSTAVFGFSIDSDTQITAFVPAQSAGTVDVTVTGLGGTSPISSADKFTFFSPVPTVTGISPSTGSTSTEVTITGSGFSPTAAVNFGSTAAGFSIDSDTQITAWPKVQSTGTVDVTVTGLGGTSPISSADKFTFFSSVPTVTGISPSTGPSTVGTSVTITGSGFNGATAVNFGSLEATSFTVNSDTQITAVSPAESAGKVDVTVTGLGRTSSISSADKFTFFSPVPTVFWISPSTGPSADGTSVTITGSGFNGATAVNFGSLEATSFTVNSYSQITATSPLGTAGTVDVTVTTPADTSRASPADQYTYTSTTSPPATTPLYVIAHSPVDLKVTDPDGRSISCSGSTVTNTITGASYTGCTPDPSVDGKVTIPDPIPGSYKIFVIPKPNVDPKSVYSLTVGQKDVILTLANAVPVKNIPSIPYEISVSETGPIKIISIPPIPEFPSPILPAILVIGFLATVLFIRKSRDQ